MGFSLSWVAIRGKSREEILRELVLIPTGEALDYLDARCTGAPLPGGWYLVVKDHDVFADAKEMARLSAGCELVTCFVEEHVMVSESAGWRDGKKVWSVTHDSQKDLGHLEARGDLPAEFPGIRDRLQTLQAEEEDPPDYIFDIPVELADALVGFRHDGGLRGSEAVTFEVLRPGRGAKKRSWWQFLFGKSTA